ncbi:MAG: helix-turn-helix transcriptional regulator [Acinetobacter sp.]|nr:helix-turn-helix transcriptional regulator [Acinetobacter sp.]
MKVHDKIRSIRTQKKLSQEKVAEQLDISTNAYSKIERGETNPSLERIQQIANIFQIDVIDLLNNDKEIFFMINENCTNTDGKNHGAIIYNNAADLSYEIEKLTLTLQHKDEIINRLQQEVELLNKLVKTLEQKAE